MSQGEGHEGLRYSVFDAAHAQARELQVT